MSVIGSRIDFTADFESLPIWWRKEATTSSAVTSLPLWKVAPLRSLKTHTVAPFEGSMVSARSPSMPPFALIRVSALPIAPPSIPVNWSG